MTKEEWAAKAWPHLVKLAKQGATMTYTEFGKEIGLNARSVGPHALHRILQYCQEEGHPTLTILITKKDGKPPSPKGTGVAIKNVEAERKKVWKFDWRKKAARPTPEMLKKFA